MMRCAGYMFYVKSMLYLWMCSTVTVLFFYVNSRVYAGELPVDEWLVSRFVEWDNLFDRTNGWTGADGIYSIPLSGKRYGTPNRYETNVFVFSDTFVGNVNSNGARTGNLRMPRNTAAVLYGNEPDKQKITFYWGTNDEGNADSLFEPITPLSSTNEWYWLSDGVVVSGRVYLFTMRMKAVEEGMGFETTGITLLISPEADPLDFEHYTQMDAPLFYDVTNDTRGAVMYGFAIMPNTVEGGAPNPDGYIYVYGHQNDWLNKQLVAARVLPGTLSDFSTWRFWGGSAWVTNIIDSAPIAERISSEFSVQPFGDDNFLLVYELDTISPYVAVNYGVSPVGPFSASSTIWTAPEVSDSSLGTNVVVYNAKAHPQLAVLNELLISYNVNTYSFSDNLAIADIYRPRFLRVRYDDRLIFNIDAASNSQDIVLCWYNNKNLPCVLEYSTDEDLDTWITLTNYPAATNQLVTVTNGVGEIPFMMYRLIWSQ